MATFGSFMVGIRYVLVVFGLSVSSSWFFQSYAVEGCDIQYIVPGEAHTWSWSICISLSTCILLLKTTLQCGIFTWHNRVWNSDRKGTAIWWWPTRMMARSTSIWWKTYSPHVEYTPGTPKPTHLANDESKWKPKANCRWIAAETEGAEWWWKEIDYWTK